jgi:hypothetical protein
MANDVEENPGPTIYDVVDPTKTICADFSQGYTWRFKTTTVCVQESLKVATPIF